MRMNLEKVGIELECRDDYISKSDLRGVEIELQGGLYSGFEGAQVVDIGGFYGETAIYFSKNGAKEVFVYEPLGTFPYIEQNIKLNNCTNIKAFNQAVGVEDRTISINNEFKNCGATRLYYAEEEGHKLEQVSLSTITKKHNIQDGYLQIDCEGMEFEILLSTPPEVLRKYKFIFIEVHALLGDEMQLREHLTKSGFNVDVSPNNSLVFEQREFYKLYECKRID